MIPLTLQIKNFLSYGPTQTINFAPYHLICLSGKNGHGKSALLDALTWVIWGQARKTANSAKPDEGLLRLGQTSMMVMLDLQIHNQVIRIRREFTQSSNKSITNLDFGIVDTQGGVKPLTDKSIRTTQEKIHHLIGLDYEGFINSVFLRQGQSNEFSKKSPKERKDILSRILGLETFELMRKQALEKIRALTLDKDYIRALIEQIELQLNQKEQIQNSLQEIIEEQTAVEKNLQEVHHDLHKLTFYKESLYQTLHQLEALLLQKNHIEITIHDKKQQILALFQEFRKTLYLTFDKNKYQKAQLEQFLLQLEEKKRIYISTQQKLLDLQEKINTHTDLLHKEYYIFLQQQGDQFHTLHNELEVLKTHREMHTNKQKDLLQHLHVNQEKINEEEIILKNQQEFLKNSEKEEKSFEKRKFLFHQWVARGNRIHAELKALQQKKLLIKNTQQSVCPLCDQLLSTHHKTHLLHSMEIEEQWYIHYLQKLSIIINDAKSRLHKQHTHLEELKKVHQEIITIKANYQTLQETRQKYKEELTHTEKLLQQIDHTYSLQKEHHTKFEQAYKNTQNFERFKEEDARYNALKEEEKNLKIMLESVLFDEKLYHETLKQLQTLPSTNSLEISSLQKYRKATIHQLIQETKTLQKQYDLLISATLKGEENKKALTECLQEEKILQEKEGFLHQQRILIYSKKGGLEQSLQSILQKEQELLELKNKMQLTLTALEEYNLIAHALSKDGIQALLIENTLPDLEQEANNLLTRLTDNQAQLSIDSMRDLKSGGTKETLDIKISDTIGIRPYELFSGGEAFRIDFALRIALSKLVARKAGTTLQTLIIDEGFGSQDEEGLAHIMDALYKIQDEFAKIIIVSHLPSLKEQFPVHFIIHKGTQGSTIAIHEQG